MRKRTEALLHRLGRLPQIGRFLLIGGTALSLLEHHRESDDLDFTIATQRLPYPLINDLINDLRRSGSHIEQVANLGAAQDFEASGLNLDDYQRDYVVDGVKLTFVSLDDQEILSNCAYETIAGIKVADLETLFRLKASLLTTRVTSRDLFDLYYLTHDKGRQVADIFAVIRRYHPTYPEEAVKYRMLSQPFPPDDPGFKASLNREISVDAIRGWFLQQVNAIEVEQVQRLAAKLDDNGSESPP